MGPGALLLSSCRLEVSGASRGEAGGGELALGALGEGGRCAWVAARSVTGLSPSTWSSLLPPLVCGRLRGARVGAFFCGEQRDWSPIPPETYPPVRMVHAELESPPPRQWGWAGERRAGWRFVGQWVGRALRRCRSLGELSVGRFPFPPFPLARDGGSGCCWQKPAGSRFVLCKRMLMAGPAMR